MENQNEIMKFFIDLISQKKMEIIETEQNNEVKLEFKFCIVLEETKFCLTLNKVNLSLEENISFLKKTTKNLRQELKKLKEGFEENQIKNEENNEKDKNEDNKFKDIIEKIYPIGSIYLSLNQSNPGDLFKIGEWEQIKDRFLIGAGNNFNPAETGGNAKHTLSIEEMPSHTHTQNPHNHSSEVYYQNNYVGGNSDGWTCVTNDSSNKSGPGNYVNVKNTTAVNNNTGGGKAFDIMNPYFGVFMWKRIK